MALFAIPNPKKTTQVDFPVERVKLSVENLNLINDKYKYTSSNEIFNQYTFEALEFLSLGVYVDINLNSISDNKTEITVEIRRKIGSFNQSYEVTKANEHIVKIFEAIAKLTMKSPEEIDDLKNAKTASKQVPSSRPDAAKQKNRHQPSGAWYERTWLVTLLCIVFFPIGLYALWKNSSIGKGWKIAVTTLIAVIVVANLGDKKAPSQDAASENNVAADAGNEPSAQIGIGQILKTEYFDITVNKAETRENIDTGNEFSDLKSEPGTLFLVINATFKNTDKESRMLSAGSVWINYNGKDYEFDRPETIMADGWGLLLDQINPLTSKTTNLVYKIPTEVKGAAYWQPGRADSDERISIGTL